MGPTRFDIQKLSVKMGGISADALLASNGGKITDIIPIFKFGYNPDVDTSIEEDVWSAGGTLARLTAAERLVISSDDALDVVIRGVDNNYNLLTETVTMNGVDDETTIGSFLSVYSAQITSNSAAINSADITALAETAGTLQFQIDAGNGQTEMCHFVVPSGYTAFIYTMFNICSRNDDALVRFQTSDSGGAYITKYVLEISDATPPVTFDNYPIAIDERHWIRIKAKAETANTRVSANYRVILFDNNYLNSIE